MAMFVSSSLPRRPAAAEDVKKFRVFKAVSEQDPTLLGDFELRVDIRGAVFMKELSNRFPVTGITLVMQERGGERQADMSKCRFFAGHGNPGSTIKSCLERLPDVEEWDIYI